MTDSPPPTLLELRVGARNHDRVKVKLSDGTELTIAVDSILELGLRTGDPVDEALRARLVDRDLHFRTREAALRLLAHRPRSRRELTDALRKRDFPRKVIEPVLQRLAEIGLLDDADFARAYIRDRLRLKPRGRRALSAELARKGVERGIVESVMDEIFAEMETSDSALAERVAAGWYRRQSAKIRDALAEGPFTEAGAKAWRRGLGHMARKGFGGGIARDALQRAAPRN